MRNALDVNGKLHIRLQQSGDKNDTSWVGYIEDPRRTNDDDIGALYYVVAVILIYGLSIVMMIASHIRKNKQDNQLRTYLKEMANLRKSDRREKVLCKMTDLANRRQKQEALETKRKIQEKFRDAEDSANENETCQPLMKKENNEDNTDSVFLPPDFSVSPGQHRKGVGVEDRLGLEDIQSESSSYRNLSVSSKGSIRNNSTGSTTQSYVPSELNSPCLSDYQNTLDRPGRGKVRSPSFHDYRKWRKPENRSTSLQDYKSVRIQESISPNYNDQRIITSQPGSRSPSLNEIPLTPMYGRERSPTVHDSRPYKWTKPRALGPSDPKFHRILEVTRVNDVKLSLPASFHVVDEDAVL